MNAQVSLCLSAILSNREGCKECGTRRGKNNINNPHMAISFLLFNSTQNEYEESSPSTKFKKFSTKPLGGISSIGSDREKLTLAAWLVSSNKRNIKKGRPTCHNARRKGTSWGHEHKVVPFRYFEIFYLPCISIVIHIRSSALIGKPYQLSTVMSFCLLLKSTFRKIHNLLSQDIHLCGM